MGRPNAHGLPEGLRRTEADGYLVDLWYLDASGKRRRFRERLGNVPKGVAVMILGKRRLELAESKLGKGAPANTTLAEAFAHYLEWAETNRPKSMAMRRTAAVRLNAKHGHRRLADLTPWLLERYKRDLGGKLMPATIDRDIAVLKHMVGLSVGWGFISREKSHALRDEVKLLGVDNTRVRFLSQEEKARLLAACAPDLRELVLGAMHLGQRVGVLVALTWPAVDLVGGSVRFPKTSGRKRSAAVPIGINAELLPALQEAHARRKSDTGHVFTTRLGRRWRKTWLHEKFTEATAAAGLEDFTFHDLRHHFASTLVQRGVSLLRVQRLLGHSQITTTAERYAHLAPEVERATDALEDKETA